MKLKVYDDSQNYTATVIQLPVKQKVDGLDNLVKVTVFGNDVLVSKDSDPNDLYIFFPAESRLSPEFCKANNLFRDVALNADDTQKGFFELHRRVRAVKFKGVISTGFVTPLTSLYQLTKTSNIGDLKVGDEFNEIDGVEICRKYISKNSVTPGTAEPKSKQDKVNNKLKDLIIPNQLRFHSETSHLSKNMHLINPSDIIVITDKWHGSSCILAKVFVNKKLTWFQKLLNKIGGQIPDREYGYVASSGKPKSNLPKVIEGLWENGNKDFYISNIWKRALNDYKHTLEDGISIYSELVGFTEGGSGIQGLYDYGCNPGQYKMVVYRITYTKPDGSVIEFSWNQIKEYCNKYELPHVEEFYFGKAEDLYNWKGFGKDDYEGLLEQWRTGFTEYLQTAFNMEQNCQNCNNKVPAEGFVLRKDGLSTFSAYKMKAKKFLKHETDDLDKGVVSLEEQN